jgi:hypothetical protein
MLLKPEAFLIIGPFCLLTSGVGLFGLDALARRLGVMSTRRTALLLVEAVVLWPATAIWGHPEDTIAVGLVAFALVAVFDERWTLAGWMLGAAIAMQLLAVLVVPLFIGAVGLKKSGPLLARAAVLPGFFAVAVLVPDYHHAIRVLLRQPTFPLVDHATPWVAFSPRLAPQVVAAGPPRLLAVAVALVAGVFAARYKNDHLFLVYLAVVVFAARCLFESVMVPYYVMPSVAMALVVAARRSWPRAMFASLAAVALTIMTHYHLDRWSYYAEMVTLFAVMIAAITSAPLATAKRDEAASPAPLALQRAGEEVATDAFAMD